MCDVATQGVWMNAVNAMYLLNQPRLVGSLDELCKPCRCRRVQLEAALAEIKGKKVGEVYEQNGNTVIECRRIRKRMEVSALKSKAGRASATKRQQTPQQAVSTRSASASASSEDRESEGKGPTNHPPLPAVIEHFTRNGGWKEADIQYAFDSLQASQDGEGFWMWGRHRVGDWRAAMETRLNDRKDKHENNGSTNKGRVNRNEGTLNSSATGQYGKLGKVGGV